MVKEGFVCPVIKPYTITQTYAEHLEYAAAHPERVYNGGIDLVSDYYSILAAWEGKVEKIAYQSGGYGNYIKLRHNWGGFSLYAHLNQTTVHIGDIVPAGGCIGLMGSTGFSTGRHLHFEIRDLSEKVLDPTALFEPEETTEHNACSPLTRLAAESGGNLREYPLGKYIVTIPYGTIGKILDGPVFRDGLPCYQVEFPVTGWIAERDHFGTMILEDYGNQGSIQQA